MLMQKSDMSRTHNPRFIRLRPCALEQCFNCYWKSKTDHLLLDLRFYVYPLYLLSCYAVGFCLFTYFTFSRSIYIAKIIAYNQISTIYQTQSNFIHYLSNPLILHPLFIKPTHTPSTIYQTHS